VPPQRPVGLVQPSIIPGLSEVLGALEHQSGSGRSSATMGEPAC